MRVDIFIDNRFQRECVPLPTNKWNVCSTSVNSCHCY